MPQVPVADIADTGMSVVPYFADGPAVTTDVVLVNMTNERAAGAVSFLGQGSSTSPAQPVEVTCAEKEIAARPPEPSKVNTKQVGFDLYKAGKNHRGDCHGTQPGGQYDRRTPCLFHREPGTRYLRISNEGTGGRNSRFLRGEENRVVS